MDILYSCFAGQAKNLPFLSLHRLTIGESHNLVSVIPFKCCSLPLVLLNGQLEEMHTCYCYVATHILKLFSNCL